MVRFETTNGKDAASQTKAEVSKSTVASLASALAKRAKSATMSGVKIKTAPSLANKAEVRAVKIMIWTQNLRVLSSSTVPSLDSLPRCKILPTK